MEETAYCREHQLNYHQFLYWHDRFIEKPDYLIPAGMNNKSTSKSTALRTVDLISDHCITIPDESLAASLK